MHTKHTFVFTLILGLFWAGLLFAYQNGPDPAANGVFGQPACNQAGCHVGSAVNAAGGTLTLSGLPAQWTPGQVYPLTVTMQRSGAVKYGFQLSAVSDGPSSQAGTLTPGSNRVQVVCGVGSSGIPVNCNSGGAVQYAEHNLVATSVAPFTGVFTVNWTAPADPNVGTVRFNLAANAANGNSQNTGDFIYTRVDRVEPQQVAPPPDLSFRAYSIGNLGGTSLITDGAGDVAVAYSRIQADAGSTTPAGVGIFGFRTNNVLVTETGVPASPLITSGRIYAEVSGAVNTGIAIANPNTTDAVINFHFTNAAGVDSGTATLLLGAGAQVARFLNESPFTQNGLIAPTLGSFTFSSSVPVSVIALRGFTNERSEFLITTLPVVDLSAAADTSTTFLPHFADGGGWKTQVVLVNPGDTTLTGTVQFFSSGSATVSGAPLTLVANSTSASTFSYSIPRQSSFKLGTAGAGTSTASGSIRVTPSSGGRAPSSLAVFTYKPGAFTVSEAGVMGVRANASRMYVEVTATSSSGGPIQTGLAIANLSPAATTLNLELNTLDGAAAGSTTVALPGNGQIAGFVHELFPSLPLPFKGVLRISGGTAAGFSVVGLRGRYNERNDFLITTTPASDEATAPSSAELLFPHLVNGGGYTTQFILFSGAAGQSASGNLRFFDQNGAALNMNVN